MPTETAPVTPAAAPAAAVVPVVPSAPAKVPDKVGSAKVEGSPSHRLFQRLTDNAPAPKDEPHFPGDKPDKPAAVKPADTPAAPAKPAGDDKPVRVSKKTPKRPDLPVPAAPVATTPVASTAPAASANWEDDLLDEERTTLEDARVASREIPEMKDLAERTEKFFKAHKKFLDENPDVEDDDPKYKELLATRPALSAAQKRTILETRVASSIRAKQQPEIEDLHHELFVRDEEPKVANERHRLFNNLAETALPEEMKKFFKDHGAEALRKHYGDEMNVAKTIVDLATDDAAELLRITRTNPKNGRPMARIAEKEGEPKYDQHQRLAQLVDDVCEEFKNTAGHEQMVRNGKWFVTRAEWAALPANARGQYWTFTNEPAHINEIISLGLRRVPAVIQQAIKNRHEQFTQLGWKRERPALTPPAAAPVAPAAVSTPSSPRSAPVPSPSSPQTAATPKYAGLAARLNNVTG